MAVNLTNANITAPGSTTSLSIGTRFNNTIPTVRDFGALGNGSTDDSAAFQAAMDASLIVRVPPGNYIIRTPVTLRAGQMILGDRSGAAIVSSTSALISPTTCAFTTPTPLTTLIQVTIDGLCFDGGTTQLDFGLWHGVTVRNCIFKGFTVAGLNIVLGEKQCLDHLWFFFTNNSTYGLGFGYQASIFYSGGLYAGQNPATFFGAADAWQDQSVFTNILFQAGASGTWTTSCIQARILSGTIWDYILFHGHGSGDGNLITVDVRLQTSEFNNIQVDMINGTGATADGISVGTELVDCVFSNCHLSYSGTSLFTNGFNLSSASTYTTTFINCGADGNNTTTFGWKFGTNVGQSATLISCDGAIYSGSSSPNIKGQLTLVSCYFAASNLPSATNNLIDYKDSGISTLIMADSNGAAAATASVNFNFASGSGNQVTPFSVSPSGAVMRSVTFTNLPTPGVAGRMLFVSNARMFNGTGTLEGAGAGTGGMVVDNGTAWKIAGTNVTASA